MYLLGYKLCTHRDSLFNDYERHRKESRPLPQLKGWEEKVHILKDFTIWHLVTFRLLVFLPRLGPSNNDNITGSRKLQLFSSWTSWIISVVLKDKYFVNMLMVWFSCSWKYIWGGSPRQVGGSLGGRAWLRIQIQFSFCWPNKFVFVFCGQNAIRSPLQRIGGSFGGRGRLARGRELCHPGLSSWVGVLRPNQIKLFHPSVVGLWMTVNMIWIQI